MESSFVVPPSASGVMHMTQIKESFKRERHCHMLSTSRKSLEGPEFKFKETTYELREGVRTCFRREGEGSAHLPMGISDGGSMQENGLRS